MNNNNEQMMFKMKGRREIMKTNTRITWNHRLILAAIALMFCMLFARSNVWASVDHSSLVTLPTNGNMTGMKRLTTTDFRHYYKFTIPQAGKVTISVANYGDPDTTSDWVNMSLYNQDETKLWGLQVSAGNLSKANVKSDWDYMEQGTYYIIMDKASASKNKNTSYTIGVNYESLNCSTGNNISMNTASPVALNNYVYNVITSGHRVAWYKYDIPQAGEYNFFQVATGYSTGKIYYTVYDSNENKLYGWNGIGNFDDKKTWNLPAGTVYIKVFSDGGFGPYKFKLEGTTVKPEPPAEENNNTQSVVVKPSKKVIRYSSLRKSKKIIYLRTKFNVKFLNVSYKLKSCPKRAKKYVKVSKTGKVTFKKGAPRGTYKFKVTVKTAAKFKGISLIVKIKVK